MSESQYPYYQLAYNTIFHCTSADTRRIVTTKVPIVRKITDKWERTDASAANLMPMVWDHIEHHCEYYQRQVQSTRPMFNNYKLYKDSIVQCVNEFGKYPHISEFIQDVLKELSVHESSLRSMTSGTHDDLDGLEPYRF